MDALVEENIRRNVPYNKLPQNLKQFIGSQAEYDRKILDFSIRYQLRFRGNLVRHVKKNEKLYYEELLTYSRVHYMLFPYHLSDFIVTGMRITPFQYYLSMLMDLLEQERSYDTLPNFTAADCLRMLAIGRNQYIDLMNEFRPTSSGGSSAAARGANRLLGVLRGAGTGSGALSAQNREKLRELLPSKPVKDIPIEHWWIVSPGYITENDIKYMVSPSEKDIIDELLSEEDSETERGGGPPTPAAVRSEHERHRAGKFSEPDVRSLFLKGLIYLDVPIEDEDLIVVPPLEGFIMNRVTGDYLEQLLYKIFVSIDAKTQVSELADVLQIDLSLAKNAVSVYCRLGFAYKKGTEFVPSTCHPSWQKVLSPHHHHFSRSSTSGSLVSGGIGSLNLQSPTSPGATTAGPTTYTLDDSTREGMSAFISGLADEDDQGVGSAENQSIADDLSESDITTGSDPGGDQTPQQKILTSHSIQSFGAGTAATDEKRIMFLYDSTLAAFLMMGNLSANLKTHAVTLFEVGKLPSELIDSLMDELAKIDELPEANGEGDACGEAERYFTNAVMLYRTLKFLRHNSALTAEVLGKDKESDQPQEGLGLDMVRCESLLALSQETCQRLLARNYCLIISVAPLLSDTSLLRGTSLPHLGPPSAAAGNPLWFRLFCYQLVAAGPDTLLLPRGFRLRQMPRWFFAYDSLLLTPWGRDSASIPLTSALLTINETLQHSALMIQGGCRQENPEENLAYVPFPFLKEENDQDFDQIDCFENHPAIQRLKTKLQLTNLCGYITLVNTKTSLYKSHSKHSAAASAAGPIEESENLINIEDSENFNGEQVEEQKNQSKKNLKNKKINVENDWTLFEVNFGIPLFDRQLNLEVCSRIAQKSLISSSSLDLVSEINSKIRNELEDFMTNLQSDPKLTGTKFHYTFPEELIKQFASIPLPIKAWSFRSNSGKLEVFYG